MVIWSDLYETFRSVSKVIIYSHP